MIEIKNVTLTYDESNRETHALKNIDLTINKSDFLVVVGPSGCGKSTLLKLIAGFIFPSNGTVSKNGMNIQGPGSDRGVVFQSTNLFPWLTVEKNIEYGLKMGKVNKESIKTLVNDYLAKTDLGNYRHYYPFELSGGMQQRVALSRTLVNKPDIVLLDEPLGALDVSTRKSMQQFLRELWRNENQTFFMITHDIDEALTLGNRVIVMSKAPGEIVAEFQTDYYKQLLVNADLPLEDNLDYIELKNKILRLIK